MTTQMFEQVKHILVERFAIDPAKIHLTTDLQKDLNLDSMDAVDLLLAINEAFSVRVPEQALENVHTIAQLIEMVEKHKPKLSV